ncbi:MAG: hypothetical protein AAGU05_11310, partial [Anaerolineaceae bacterium]
MTNQWKIFGDASNQDQPEDPTSGLEEVVFDTEPTGKQPQNFPDTIAILPLRGLVVYPQTAVPLTIGQPRS